MSENREKQLFDALQIWEVLLGGRSYSLDAFIFLNLSPKTIRRHLATLERIETLKVKHTKFGQTTYWRSDYRPRPRDPALPTKKRCSGCGHTLPIEEFSRNRYSADKHHAYCRQCRHDYYQAYYQNNCERLKKNDRVRYLRRRTKLLAYMKRRYQQKKKSE